MRTRFQYLFVAAVFGVVCGTSTTARAQWGYVEPVAYGPVPIEAYRPIVVAQPVIFSQPAYVAYSSPYVYGYAGYGYGYGVGPRVVRDRSNIGLFGHYNYHHHARGPGFGHYHYHARSPGYYVYGW